MMRAALRGAIRRPGYLTQGTLRRICVASPRAICRRPVNDALKVAKYNFDLWTFAKEIRLASRTGPIA